MRVGGDWHVEGEGGEQVGKDMVIPFYVGFDTKGVALFT
jgi:hypothetical protein